MMEKNKNLGAYYTPDFLTDFIVERLSDYLNTNDNLKILEPSVGDGAFIRSMSKHLKHQKHHLTIIDVVNDEVEKAKEVAKNSFAFIDSYCQDFLSIEASLFPRFDLIIGNPPYIKTSGGALSERAKELCQVIYESAQIDSNKVRNIWIAFLIHCCKLLNTDGIIAMVLPHDLLQTIIGKKICNFIHQQFARSEFFVFNDLHFQKAEGQKTVIFIGYKTHSKPGQFYQLEHHKEVYSIPANKNKDNKIGIKELYFGIIGKAELKCIEDFASKFPVMADLVISRPGLVTAANSYFIVNETTLQEFKLQKYSKRIIQKSSLINGKVDFDEGDFISLCKQDKPTYFIDLSTYDKTSANSTIEKYLEVGQSIGLHNRYKMKIRPEWYIVPGNRNASPILFFKRSHLYPKLILNSANVLATDSAYLVNPVKGIDAKSLVFCFYNTLTLTFAELLGRNYGGGVLELVPSEFQSLPIPYKKIRDEDFENFENIFSSKSSISDVSNYVDNALFGQPEYTNEITKLIALKHNLLNFRLGIAKHSSCV